jgi:hypothetical protein
MMDSAKEALRKTIDLLSDEEARQILKFSQRLRRGSDGSQTLRRLAHDATFHVPSEVSVGFRIVKPIQGKGIAASKLLVKDRR